MEAAVYTRPALTSVRQPIAELGGKAVELLLAVVDGEEPCEPCPRLILEPELKNSRKCNAASSLPCVTYLATSPDDWRQIG
jgi:DNA-binding LacI/PurR family transcriptional regulator